MSAQTMDARTQANLAGALKHAEAAFGFALELPCTEKHAAAACDNCSARAATARALTALRELASTSVERTTGTFNVKSCTDCDGTGAENRISSKGACVVCGGTGKATA